jgi:nitrogen fixation protein NifU and related proteins
MDDALSELYQEVILDHSRSPRNFRKIERPSGMAEGHNPLCGDRITVYLLMDGDRIKDVSFEGSGCAISKASASIMTEELKGKTKAEAEKMFERVHEMLTTGETNQEEFGKLAALAGVHRFPARIKCATLSWHAAVASLKGSSNKVSTE